MKQLHIEGTAPPVRPEIDEALDELLEAREALKQANERHQRALDTVCRRMMNAKEARYEHPVGARVMSVELDLPEPKVKVKLVDREVED